MEMAETIQERCPIGHGQEKNNIDIYDIKKLASDLKITKAATVNTKELLLEKIAVFYNCL